MFKSKLITAVAVAALAGSLIATDAFAGPRSAPTSISRGAHGNGPNGNGPNTRPNRGDNDGNRVNIGNDVDIDIDTDPGWDHDHRHPIATAVAVSTVVAIGTRVYVLPTTGCTTTYYAGVTYTYCGSTWYRPYYSGTTVSYVVVARPY